MDRYFKNKNISRYALFVEMVVDLKWKVFKSQESIVNTRTIFFQFKSSLFAYFTYLPTN